MGVVINIRGINASGKSTAVREYCLKHNLRPETIMYKGREFKIMTDGEKVAIGWYKPYSNSEGCDPLTCDKEEFKRFLIYFIKSRSPEVIVYEKAIWSHTFKLANEIRAIASSLGYGFIAVVMSIDYTNALNRLFNRNGGKEINLSHYDNSYRCIYRSRRMMIESGITVYDADVMKIPKEKMAGVVDAAITMFRTGKRGKIEENIS